MYHTISYYITLYHFLKDPPLILITEGECISGSHLGQAFRINPNIIRLKTCKNKKNKPCRPPHHHHHPHPHPHPHISSYRPYRPYLKTAQASKFRHPSGPTCSKVSIRHIQRTVTLTVAVHVGSLNLLQMALPKKKTSLSLQDQNK